MEEQTVLEYKQAPTRIQVGRVVMFIGCLFFFIAAILDLVSFIVAVVRPADFGVDWSDVGDLFSRGSLPILSAFFVFAGIGGICFIVDKGGKMRKFATLAAVVMLVVFIVDTLIAVRGLVRNIVNPEITGEQAWSWFLGSLLDIQVSGGLYLIGWAIIKDYTGD